MDLRRFIRDVPDFPRPGIVFKDITPLLQHPKALDVAVQKMKQPWMDVALVAGIEARGFIFGSLLARALNVGFVPIRKAGKLPLPAAAVRYALEYGTGALELHRDAIAPGQRVLIVDDLLATGGTAAAAGELVKRAGGTVAGFSFLIELRALAGRKKLRGQIESVLVY
ncbi:MAG: adenine phosphoribosyltransferase [Candidatus Aenigmarchaeota archaeon]|nr:adenine phosphoribosyltransferase [Candidatus Aenigmarchaeota archaeon]